MLRYIEGLLHFFQGGKPRWVPAPTGVQACLSPKREALSPQLGSIPTQCAWKARCFTRARTLGRRSAPTVRKLDEIKYPKQYLFLERMHLFGSCKTTSISPDIHICTEIQEAFRHHAPPSWGWNLVAWRHFTHPISLHIFLFRLTRQSREVILPLCSALVKHIFSARSNSERHGRTGVRPADGYKNEGLGADTWGEAEKARLVQPGEEAARGISVYIKTGREGRQHC